MPVERIVLCGPGSAISGLAERMEAGLGLPIATAVAPPALAELDAQLGGPAHPLLRPGPGELMRPVNLIPVEERPGEHGPMRSGPVVYIVVGALVAALVGVTAMVLTGNQISESKAEVVRLHREDAAASARAQRLAAYTSFRTLSEQQVATVTSLADSRFDWERVMRELALVLPGDVWLVNLTATARPKRLARLGQRRRDSGGGLRSSIPGPALQLSGCAVTHDGVAGLVVALKDIDGVTRVGVESSALPETKAARVPPAEPARRAKANRATVAHLASSPSSRSSSPSTRRRSRPAPRRSGSGATGVDGTGTGIVDHGIDHHSGGRLR